MKSTSNDQSSPDDISFKLPSRINVFFIILTIISGVLIGISFIGMFNQFTQPEILYITVLDETDPNYTLSLEKNTLYYIKLSCGGEEVSGDLFAVLKFYDETEKVYEDSIQRTPLRVGRKSVEFLFAKFIPEKTGLYTISLTLDFPDGTYPFYFKMQRANDVSQITGLAGEEMLAISMISFIGVMVLLIIVSIIYRVKHTLVLRARVEEKPSDEFTWISKSDKKESDISDSFND
ncbi:MAG: hypothetical protein ACXADY_17265 [Candidatus Hodarchaeales archaeon]